MLFGTRRGVNLYRWRLGFVALASRRLFRSGCR